MPRARAAVTTALVAYNLIQNRVLPSKLYVPANLTVSGALLVLARRQGCTWDELGLDRRRARSGLQSGSTLAFLVVLTAVLAESMPGVRRHLRDDRAADQKAVDILYNIFIRYPLGTALFEEVAFRGVVEGIWAREGATERKAAAAAAVLFGLWHLIPTSDALRGNPLAGELRGRRAGLGVVLAGAATTGVVSLGFSRLRRKSGSLLAPWVVHTAMSVSGYLAGIRAWARPAVG